MNIRDLLELLIHAILAIFGVSARELRYKDERSFKIARLVSDAIVASFGATIVFFVSSMSGLPLQMGYIIAGLVGWGGPQIIDKLFEKYVDVAKDMEQIPAEKKAIDATIAGDENDGKT